MTVGYGLTETTTGTHLLLFDAADRKVGSIGTLVANVEARIIHDEDGKVEAGEGEPGELWMRSKTIMKVKIGKTRGYLKFICDRGISIIRKRPRPRLRRMGGSRPETSSSETTRDISMLLTEGRSLLSTRYVQFQKLTLGSAR